MSGLDGNYWNTIDVYSPRLRRRASMFIPSSPHPTSKPIKKKKKTPLKPIIRNKKTTELDDNTASSPLNVIKKEQEIKKEEILSTHKKKEITFSNENNKIYQENDTISKVQINEEYEKMNINENIIKIKKEEKENVVVKIENDKEDSNEPFFDDASIITAIEDATSDDNEYYDQFSYNEDSNFGIEDSVVNLSDVNITDQNSVNEQQIIIDDTTIPLDVNNIHNVNDSNDVIINDETTIPLNNNDTNILNNNNNNKLNKHKSHKQKQSNYLGLDGTYWNFTDKKRESTRHISPYDITLHNENIKRKKVLSTYEYEKERKKRRLAEQERLLKYGPRKPSQRSIEEKQRLIQQRLATMELNALEIIGAEVIPGLYVGSKYAARNPEWIKSTGVNYVVNCTPSTACNVVPGVVYHNISIDDSPSEKDTLKKIIGNEVNYIASVLNNPQNKVLVHCNYGKSRSPTLVICYLIMMLHWSLEDAYKKVDECRKGISINIGFLQLIESIAEKVHGKKITE